MSDYTDKCKTCVCRIVCKEDVSTDDFACEIAHEALEAKFKSDNTQSDAITLWKEWSAAATDGHGEQWLFENDKRINAVIA